MANNVIAQVDIIPLGTASTSLGLYVAACLKVLKQAKDVKYEITASGTIIEGPLDRVLGLVRQMHEVPFEIGARRVYTTLSIDDRRDKPATIASKVSSVNKP